jgi:hypothetical protein
MRLPGARAIATLWPLIAFSQRAAPVVPPFERLSADSAAISLPLE